jgi:hypothetical protein
MEDLVMCKYFGLCGSVENCVCCEERVGDFVTEYLANCRVVLYERREPSRAKHLVRCLKAEAGNGYFELTDEGFEEIAEFERDIDAWLADYEANIDPNDYV